MTPQQKAESLIKKFTYFNSELSKREGILSALNCVSEILDCISGLDIYYWDQVREEILKFRYDETGR